MFYTPLIKNLTIHYHALLERDVYSKKEYFLLHLLVLFVQFLYFRLIEYCQLELQDVFFLLRPFPKILVQADLELQSVFLLLHTEKV